MAKQPDIQIILPAVSDDEISEGLRELTRAIDQAGGDISAGLLGGEYGYGGMWDSPVFMMRPFCWCMQADCPWCLDCECVTRWDTPDGEYVQGAKSVLVTKCRNCRGEYPDTSDAGGTKEDPRGRNFWHKPSGVKVRWYKFIGRGMEVEYPVNRAWSDILAECIADVRK